MRRSPIIVAELAALTVCFISVASHSRQSQSVKPPDIIKAEVIGTLHFQESQGYFISVRSSEHPGWENRVWLWVSENKVFLRHLDGLVEKRVMAKGELEQMPDNVQANVPTRGMYLKNLEVEAALAK